MKNRLILLVFVCLFVMSVVQEPVTDTIDAVAGATNATYSTSIDDQAGASEEEDDDEHEGEDE